MAIGMRTLRQYAEFKSRGEIEIRILWNTLGGSLQVTEQVKNATLDMALTDDSVLGSFHKPIQAFQIPYLFASSAAAWEFTNTQVVRDMVDSQGNAPTTVLDGKIYEVQKFMSVNEHIYGYHLIVINDGVFQKLSSDHRKSWSRLPGCMPRSRTRARRPMRCRRSTRSARRASRST